MTLKREFKVGDRVCSYEGKKGVVTKINGHRTIAELYTVSVEWDNPRDNRLKSVYSADCLWLEGQPAKLSYGEKQLLLEATQVRVYEPTVATPDLNREPINEDATLEHFADEVARWADIVQYLDGNDVDDDIDHDLFSRQCLHGMLNGLKKQDIEIPAELIKKLKEADQYFIENSIGDSPKANASLEDDVFWYRSRWPKAKTK